MSPGSSLELGRGYWIHYADAAQRTVVGDTPETLITALEADSNLVGIGPVPLDALSLNYAVPHSGLVSLRVYDITGQRVRPLVSATQTAGTYQVAWDGRDETGRTVATGVFLYELKAREFRAVNKMLMVR